MHITFTASASITCKRMKSMKYSLKHTKEFEKLQQYSHLGK